jgi:hypothetical protein
VRVDHQACSIARTTAGADKRREQQLGEEHVLAGLCRCTSNQVPAIFLYRTSEAIRPDFTWVPEAALRRSLPHDVRHGMAPSPLSQPSLRTLTASPSACVRALRAFLSIRALSTFTSRACCSRAAPRFILVANDACDVHTSRHANTNRAEIRRRAKHRLNPRARRRECVEVLVACIVAIPFRRWRARA